MFLHILQYILRMKYFQLYSKRSLLPVKYMSQSGYDLLPVCYFPEIYTPS